MENELNVDIYENVFAASDEIFQRLEKEIVYLPPDKSQICFRGKRLPVPRQIAAYGELGVSYSFSGLTLTCSPWTSLLSEIKSAVEKLTGQTFNFVLINRYSNGNSYIAQHKDNEVDLDNSQAICSVSFGETRTIVFKRASFPNYKFELNNNSALVMKPPTNQYWTHGIPRQKEKEGVRISLTFRKISTSKRKTEDVLLLSKKQKKENEVSIFFIIFICRIINILTILLR